MKPRVRWYQALLPCLGMVILFYAYPAYAVDITKCSMVAEGPAQIISFGAEQNDGRPVTLQGILTLPSGPGPYPAIVMLSGGGGLSTPYCYRFWVDRFASWGYAILIVAGTTAHDVAGKNLLDYSFLDQANYAHGALSALATISKVDVTRIAVWGFSRGAIAAIEVASGRRQDVRKFRAVIAAAPVCPATEIRPHTPLLVMIGNEDAIHSASSCVAYASKLKEAKGFEFQLLPGAKHVF